MSNKTSPPDMYEKYVAKRYAMKRRRQYDEQFDHPNYHSPRTSSSSDVRTTPMVCPVAPPTPPPEVTLDNATEEQMVEINKLALEIYLKQWRMVREERNNTFDAEWVEMKTAVWYNTSEGERWVYLIRAVQHLYSEPPIYSCVPVTVGQ